MGLKASPRPNKREILYTSTSDEKGVAVVTDLPSGRNSYSIVHEKYVFPAQPSIGNRKWKHRRASIELKSGERTVTNAVLIEKGMDSLGGGTD